MTTATRAATTRGALLTAAREVFAASGFAEASVADVVDRAGASVGSLYHHFGGKADLYLALFEEHSARQEERASAAVRSARAAGERDPVTLFVAGARGYLQGSWAERDLARLFLAGGGPPGFELTARRRNREWTVLNAHLLRTGEQPWSPGPGAEAVVLVLTTVVREAGHEVAVCDDEATATALAEEFLALIEKIGRR
ncbi:MAG: transcriptional regulator, TetR family [Frankiales bacterium]|nr:transcriptional regulator, TetR family [Frankiales bacterium]